MGSSDIEVEIRHCERTEPITVVSPNLLPHSIRPCEVKLIPGVLFYDVALEDGTQKRFCHACITLDVEQGIVRIVNAGVVQKDGTLSVYPNDAKGVPQWRKEAHRVQAQLSNKQAR